jgi:hypothetical protein
MSRGRRTGPPPSHLRLITPADNPNDETTSGRLPAGCAEVAVGALMATLRATAVEVTDRAVDAMRGEINAYGLDFDPETLAGIRKATFVTVATGIYGRIERGFRGDPVPGEDDRVDDPDDNMHPYVEHTGTGLRERLRAALEADNESS